MTDTDYRYVIGCVICVGAVVAIWIIPFMSVDPVEIRIEYDVILIDDSCFTYIDSSKMMCKVEYVNNPLVQVYLSDRVYVVYVVSYTVMRPYYELYLNVNDRE